MSSSPLESSSALQTHYRHIYLLDSAQWWDEEGYDPSQDLVLTYDFGLHHRVTQLGGDVVYLDHLKDRLKMQKNNFLVADFFHSWHFDSEGNDLFVYKGIPFGFSFRLDIWNDLITYTRLRVGLNTISNLHIKKIFVGTEDRLVTSILDDLHTEYELLPKPSAKVSSSYYFPIAQWMDQRIRAKGFRGFLVRLREIVTAVYGYTMPFVDKLLFWQQAKQTVFIQEYHPTRKLIEILKKDPSIRVLLVNFTRGSKLLDHWFERLIPISGSRSKFDAQSTKLLDMFRKKRHAKLILDDGQEISDLLYTIIETRIQERITDVLRILDSVIAYLDRNPLHLEVLIANIGLTATLVDCVCRARGIPSYLIINGMLGKEYSDESKYATFINGYSTSIKEHYFRGMDNIVCLGDPRMDMYPPSIQTRRLNRSNPTITIGTSGFNPIDLNSYVAVEFEFMHDVLSALQKLISEGVNLTIIIKIRPNGYKKQYENFVTEFFPDLKVQLLTSTPIRNVLEKTDFYISIYSQTLFEASCLGVPALYYKKDDEFLDPPFDNQSELVSADNVDDLYQAIVDFMAGDERYLPFLDRRVMEKYIGPLDGQNTQRNLDYIYSLLARQKDAECSHG